MARSDRGASLRLLLDLTSVLFVVLLLLVVVLMYVIASQRDSQPISLAHCELAEFGVLIGVCWQQLIWSASWDKSACLWDLRVGSVVNRWELNGKAFCMDAVGPNSVVVGTSAQTNNISIIDQRAQVEV
jgi:hypothetical protein